MPLASIKGIDEGVAKMMSHMIKDAFKNFKEALISFKNYDWFTWWLVKEQKTEWTWLTDRQMDLLRIVYWLEANELNTSQIETWKKNWANIKKEINPFSDVVYAKKTVINWSVDTETKVKNEWKKQQDENWKALTEDEINKLESNIYWLNISSDEKDKQLLQDMQELDQNLILLQKIFRLDRQ